MLRLDQRYFRSLTLPFVLLLIALTVVGYYLLRGMEVNNYRTMLRNLITQYTLTPPSDVSHALVALHRQTGVRVTLIDANGVVTAESNRDPEGMENHRNRPEIIQARNSGWGSAVRHSATLDRDMLYVAHKIGDQYVRMAFPLSTIQEKFLPLWLKIMGLFGLALVAAIWIATRTNRLIRSDVHRINTSLDHLLAKEYDQTTVRVECCDELHAIARQITKVAAKLKKRDRQKAKYTKKLKRLTQQQGEIISAISHEFKNPVAAIIGYATTVHDDPELSPQLRSKFLEKVINNSQRINDMIDRLSLAIKFENNSLEPRMESFDLSHLLDEVVDSLRQKYPDRTLEMETESTPVTADRMMMAQVLSNLIDNALKYSEDEVRVRLTQTALEVTDQGIGIAPDSFSKITQRFYRADTQSWDNSIGVGLFIVAYILQLHRTELTIESTPGQGSTFGFLLSSLK